MKRLTVCNGDVVDVPEVRLNCTRCDERTRWRKRDDDTVECERCGKRHARASLVDTNTPLEVSKR